MMGFWLVAALLIAAALAMVVVPLWRARPEGAGDDGRSVNVALYRQRRAELEQDLANGTIARDEYGEALAELDRQLVEDAGDPDSSAPAPQRSRRWIVAAVALLVPALAVGLYAQVGGGPAALNIARSGGSSASDDGNARHEDIEAMVRNLAERLERNPDDGRGWLMLGRSYTVMERYEKAVDALAEARERLGDRPDVLTLYAQALAMTREPRSLAGRPGELLDKALEADPDQARALWLGGVAAAERGSYRVAIERWQRLLDKQGENGPGADVLRDNIAAARARLEGAGAAGSASREAGGTAPRDPASGSAAKAEIEVRVSLAGELAGRAAGSDTVFVFARAVDGSPMPLAVVRLRVSELPAEVTLDEGDAMTPRRSLADFDRVSVAARVSRSGGVRASRGDLEAVPREVDVRGDEAVSLRIDTVVE